MRYLMCMATHNTTTTETAALSHFRCEVCRRFLPAQTAGRPRLYHPECKAVRDRMALLDTALNSITFLSVKCLVIRGALWGMGNALRAGTLDTATITIPQGIKGCKDCAVCGMTLPEQTGRGRRRMYHPACKRVRETLSWLLTGLRDVSLGKRSTRDLRMDLWSMGNEIRVGVDEPARRTFGRKVRAAREAAAMTPTELAKALGWTNKAGKAKAYRVSHIEVALRGASEEEARDLRALLPIE